MSAGRTTPLSALDVASVTDAARRSKYASAAAEHDTSLIAKLLDARDVLREQQAQFRRQQDAAQAERDAAAQARASIGRQMPASVSSSARSRVKSPR